MEKNGISNNNGTSSSSSNNKPSIVKSSPQLVPLSELISDSNNPSKEINLPLEEALNHPGPSQIILDQSVLMGLLNSIQILKNQTFIGYLGGRWIGKVKGDKVKAVGWVKHFVTCQRSLENILNEDLLPDNNSVQLAEQTFKDLGLQVIGWFRSDQLSQKGSILVDYKLAQNLQTKYPHLIKVIIPSELIITRGASNHCPDWQIYRVPSSAELKSNSNKSKNWEKIGYAINSQPYTSPQILKELQNIFQNLAIEGKKTYEIQQAYHKDTSQTSNFNNFLYESELINLSKTCLSTFELGLNNDFQKLALSKLKLKELINLKLKELELSLSEQSSTDLNLTGDELYNSIKQLVEYAALRPNKKGFSNSNQISGSGGRLGSKSYTGSGDPLFEMPAFPQ